AQRLIGQARDRLGHVGARELGGARGELRDRARPLLLDALVGCEHERALADAPDQLDAEQRLARARRRDDVRPLAPVVHVLLERRQRRALVGAPLAAELELVESAQSRARSCASACSVSRLTGKPSRWTPSRSATTVCTE